MLNMEQNKVTIELLEFIKQEFLEELKTTTILEVRKELQTSIEEIEWGIKKASERDAIDILLDMIVFSKPILNT